MGAIEKGKRREKKKEWSFKNQTVLAKLCIDPVS